jgi:hypothetical protein
MALFEGDAADACGHDAAGKGHSQKGKWPRRRNRSTSPTSSRRSNHMAHDSREKRLPGTFRSPSQIKNGPGFETRQSQAHCAVCDFCPDQFASLISPTNDAGRTEESPRG